MKITKFRVNGEEALVSESALAGQLLPPPSAEDAGKAVVVDSNGSYALDSVGGGAVIVTITSNADFPPVYTVNKTAAEVYAAVQSGKVVYGYFDPRSGTVTCYSLTSIGFDGQTPFQYVLSSVNGNVVNLFYVYEKDGVTTVTRDSVPIPRNS